MGLFEWWSGLPAGIRYGIAITFLLISTALFFLMDRLWPWGWVVGSLMLVFGGPSESERRGGF